MKKFIIAPFLVLFLSISSIAQENTLADLNFYSDIMVNANSESHRIRANNDFLKIFDEVISSDGAFNFPFESIPYIKTLIPQDSTFKIVTFNYADESGKTIDFGYVVLPDAYFKLNPTNELDDIVYEQLDSDRWVSGLYFHMIPFENNDKMYYLLFGFSQPNIFEKRKVLEVFSIEDGVPTFGQEFLIERQEGARDIAKFRELYYYSADVSMSIRDDSDFNAIVVDHLMEVKSRIPGNPGNSFVPDGTYTAFFLKNGIWEYKDKLFEAKDVQILEKEETEKDERNIFGKRKN